MKEIHNKWVVILHYTHREQIGLLDEKIFTDLRGNMKPICLWCPVCVLSCLWVSSVAWFPLPNGLARRPMCEIALNSAVNPNQTNLNRPWKFVVPLFQVIDCQVTEGACPFWQFIFQLWKSKVGRWKARHRFSLLTSETNLAKLEVGKLYIASRFRAFKVKKLIIVFSFSSFVHSRWKYEKLRTFLIYKRFQLPALTFWPFYDFESAFRHNEDLHLLKIYIYYIILYYCWYFERNTN